MAKRINQHKAYNLNVATAQEATYELKHHGDGSWLIVSSNESVPNTFNLTLIDALNILLERQESWSTRVDLRSPITDRMGIDGPK